jgi:signal transduction histidine kinase
VTLAETTPQHCSHTAEQAVYGLEQTSDADTTLMRFIHELRAPAATIYQTLDVVLQGYTDGSLGNQVEMLCLARDRARAMLGMINDCLLLGAVRQAEADTGKASVQLAEVLWKVLPAMRIKATVRGIELIVDVQDSLPLVGIAEEYAAQVLSNLIDNAIKYTHAGGQVVVCLKAADGLVTGTVEDTGIGIAPHDVSRIFDGFFRARNAKQIEPYGTGLGLYLVKCLVETHDGHIDVESEQGKGSKFTFSLPVVEGAGDAGSLLSNTGPGQ